MKRQLILPCLALILGACAQTASTNEVHPSPPPTSTPVPTSVLTGTWSGPISNGGPTQGEFRFVFVEAGGTVMGEAYLKRHQTPPTDFIDIGPISGTLVDSQLDFTLEDGPPSSYTYAVHGRVSDTAFGGRATYSAGDVVDTLLFTVTKQ